MKKIRFQVGGAEFHPVEQQAAIVAALLGPAYDCQIVRGSAAFEQLGEVDLLVPMGLFSAGLSAVWPSAPTYEPLGNSTKQALRDYVASGRPLLCFHGCIAAHDDWPEYGDLLGYQWLWGLSAHTPVSVQTFKPLADHPILKGVGSFDVEDETYFNIQFRSSAPVKVLGEVNYRDAKMPVLFETEGGRIQGAGKSVYVANGHDMRAFAGGQTPKLIANAVRYLID
jgi:type 1 glutamine amidotransferase